MPGSIRDAQGYGRLGRALTKPGLEGGSLEEVTSELRLEGSGGVHQMQGQQALEW